MASNPFLISEAREALDALFSAEWFDRQAVAHPLRILYDRAQTWEKQPTLPLGTSSFPTQSGRFATALFDLMAFSKLWTDKAGDVKTLDPVRYGGSCLPRIP